MRRLRMRFDGILIGCGALLSFSSKEKGFGKDGFLKTPTNGTL
jgi:hypothetical protein